MQLLFHWPEDCKDNDSALTQRIRAIIASIRCKRLEREDLIKYMQNFGDVNFGASDTLCRLNFPSDKWFKICFRFLEQRTIIFINNFIRVTKSKDLFSSQNSLLFFFVLWCQGSYCILIRFDWKNKWLLYFWELNNVKMPWTILLETK